MHQSPQQLAALRALQRGAPAGYADRPEWTTPVSDVNSYRQREQDRLNAENDQAMRDYMLHPVGNPPSRKEVMGNMGGFFEGTYGNDKVSGIDPEGNVVGKARRVKVVMPGGPMLNTDQYRADNTRDFQRGTIDSNAAYASVPGLRGSAPGDPASFSLEGLRQYALAQQRKKR